MTVRVLVSSMSHRRIARARAWLEAREPAEEVLIVGANLDAANEVARGVAQMKGAAFGWHRLSLTQLAAALAAPTLAARSTVPVSRLGTQAMAARVVHALAASGALGRYASVAQGPGFARAIASVVMELRLAKVDRDQLRSVSLELATLLETYESNLAEAALTDWAGVLISAVEAVMSRDFAHRLVGWPTLLLDVPLTSEAELAFVRSLGSRTSEILVIMPAADESTLTRLRKGLRVELENLDDGDSSPGNLARLQRHIFNEETISDILAPDGQVVVFSAPGEGRECVEIARRILDLAKGGLAFDRMAVLLRSPEEYRASLEEAFARAGVPAHFARGSVRPDPSGKAFCVLLHCAAEGLSARRFAEYLSLGQVPDATAAGTPPESAPRSERWVPPDAELVPTPLAEALGDQPALSPSDIEPVGRTDSGPVTDGQLRAPWRWERLLVEAAVIGGRQRWRARIEGLANDLQIKFAELVHEDEARAAIVKRTAEDLEAFAAYVLPLIDALDALPKSANWGEWLDKLGALATRALRRPDRVLSVLSELAPMASVGPVTLEEVLLVISDLLIEVSVPPSRQRYGRVFVGPIDAARGLNFEAVFVPGLAEKLFPHKIIEEPILLDAARQRLNAELLTNQDRLANERLALALAAGAAHGRFSFSYPRLDLDNGRPRVPSFYALETVRAAEGQLPNFAELARRAETATSSRIGWPAPGDPAEAIDDAEYDLAILNRLSASEKDGAGLGRYILTVNPYVARALRARFQRWSFHWTQADGLLARSDAALAIMAKHGFDARSYSPTALQHYAGCPYKFFLQAVQGLAPREVPEPIDELDPFQRGSLIHDIQFTLFGQLRDKALLPVRPQNLNRIWDMLDGVINEVGARYCDDLAPAIDRVWEDGIAAIRADLREWLRLASEDTSGYVPHHFELSFGLAHRNERRQADPASVPGAVGLDCGIQLRGSIDLVESHPSGTARVTDHKSGKAEGKPGQLVAGGRSLQPVFYALAAEKIFADKMKVECGRLYFCTSIGGFAEHVVLLDEFARKAALAVAETIGGAIGRPFLPAAPADRHCEWCDYRAVCGPDEERRTARKPKENLGPLLTLRGMP
jgi:ATP-dependent helicase/nuclease subunit B